MKGSLPLIFSLLCCAALTQCTTTTGGGAVSRTSLGTPNHSLPKDEYPFDEKGNYREDWVVAPSGVSSRGSSSSRGSTSSSSTRSSSSSSRSSSSSSRSTTRYHLVQGGDTLWGLSRKYGVSVSAIKSANSLRSDTIRTGSTLRIP